MASLRHSVALPHGLPGDSGTLCRTARAPGHSLAQEECRFFLQLRCGMLGANPDDSYTINQHLTQPSEAARPVASTSVIDMSSLAFPFHTRFTLPPATPGRTDLLALSRHHPRRT
jgi:hypothetical protein